MAETKTDPKEESKSSNPQSTSGDGTGNKKNNQQQEPPKEDKWEYSNQDTTMEYWSNEPGDHTDKTITHKGEDGKSKTSTVKYTDVGDANHLTSDDNRIQHLDQDTLLNTYTENLNINNVIDDTRLKVLLPNYGVADFINERAMWQKGTYNTLGEQGWFYFKIFFNFKDSKLFNGFLDIYQGSTYLLNTCALRYLYGIRNQYPHDRIHDRIMSLARFTTTLSYINTICPWFFKSISNIGKLNSLGMSEFTKEKYITIQCDSEAIDMKLNTLFDLYRFACYDDIYKKEIIPENLRKFDMEILIMNIPLKYFQTAFTYASTSQLGSALLDIGGSGIDDVESVLNVGAKTKETMDKVGKTINKISSFIAGTQSNSFNFKEVGKTSELLSFQLFSIKNCEFVINDSLEGYYNNSLSNSEFFNLGNNTIKIKYDSVYKHSYNEWENIFYGSTLFFNDDIYKNPFLQKVKEENELKYIKGEDIVKMQSSRIEAIKNNIQSTFFSPGNSGVYKSLIDFSENMIKDSLIGVNNPKSLGNIGDSNDIAKQNRAQKYGRAVGAALSGLLK